MSLKWEKTKAWDRENLTGALTPVRLVLRLFSSVWLGVSLLTLVAIYGALASIPVGMFALIPTYLIYGATALLAILLFAALPAWLLHRTLAKAQPAAKSLRFVSVFFVSVIFAAASLWLWYTYAWPRLLWDPAKHTGLRLFADFVETNKLITLRRLPAFEMSELEFYAWWPLRLLLGLFVTNMVITTVRRIEFDFKHIGVLTVHSGIILIALGSFMYGSGKIEGDTLLMAGQLGTDGKPEPGEQQDSFYDYQKTALYVAQKGYWEQRSIEDLPRYNDYNIAIVGPAGAIPIREAAAQTPPYFQSVNAKTDGIGAGTLDITVARPVHKEAGTVSTQDMRIDGDLQFKIVGYASYADTTDDFIERKIDQTKVSLLPEALSPLRVAYLLGGVRSENNPQKTDRVFSFVILPHDPSQRIRDSRDLAIEYTRGTVRPSLKAKLESGMSPQRWADLAEKLPPHTRHALIVETAANGVAQPTRLVMAVAPGTKFKVGSSGYEIEVKDLAEQPPFPIITEGYKGATSSVAIVRVTQPDGKGFDRYIYHRFPEINQDLLDELSEQGRPKRRDADPAIRISYIDATKLQIYIDEIANSGGEKTRILIRNPAGTARVIEDIGSTNIVDEIFNDPKIGLEISVRWADSRKVQRPLVVAESERERDRIGSHQSAMIGVEISSVSGSTNAKAFSEVVWVPFSAFVREMPQSKAIVLEDGREIELVFGRRRYGLPGFELQLLDFHMIPNENRGPPKDYQSLIRVVPSWRAAKKIEPFIALASLNEPLRAPFHWDDEKPYIANAAAKMLAGLDPSQLKFSQAGWDAAGWERTQKETDAGMRPRPYIQFTRLQVGNNPGIHIIALGGILMGAGIPWAFYVKPWLVQREKKKIQQQLKDGTYIKPTRIKPTQTTSDKPLVQGSAS